MRLVGLRRFRSTAGAREADLAQVHRAVQSDSAKLAEELKVGTTANRASDESMVVYRLGGPELGYSEVPRAPQAHSDTKLGNLGPLL